MFWHSFKRVKIQVVDVWRQWSGERLECSKESKILYIPQPDRSGSVFIRSACDLAKCSGVGIWDNRSQWPLYGHSLQSCFL